MPKIVGNVGSAKLSRRNLIAGSLGGLFVSRVHAQAPAIVTSKNRVQSPACTLAPEQTEGPYYIDGALIRSNITEGRPGIPLRLRIIVLDALRCKPIENAAVSIWHCDASGVYSGFTADGIKPGMRPPMGMMGGGRPPGPPPPPFGRRSTDTTRFFRGIQMTDREGAAEFVTIYPGWYVGRDTHIHTKVQTQGSASEGTYTGGHVCHTGQLFFPDDISDTVARLGPYAGHKAERTRQQNDDIFTSQHGSEFVLALTQDASRSLAEGFHAQVALGVDPNAEPAPVGFGGGPPPLRDKATHPPISHV